VSAAQHSVERVRPGDLGRWKSFLARETGAMLRSGDGLRPWDLWELHNPWSRAAARVNAWGFLEICHAEGLLTAVAHRLGPDVILFDSQILPNPALSGIGGTVADGTMFFPVEPMSGTVVRIPFAVPGDAAQPEQPAVVHSPDLEHDARCGENGTSFEYVIRYFAATSRYLRDPTHFKHDALREAFPWINYCEMPLWLACGEDRAGNDFASGFQPRPGRWTSAGSA
jgi:hypothetical protein